MTIGTPVSLGTVSAAAGSTTLALTTTASAPAGSAIVVFASDSSTVAPTSIADSASNAYANAAVVNNGTGKSRAFLAVNVAALASGGTITVTYGGTGGTKLLSAFAITGLAARDIAGAGASGTSTAPSIATGALGWPAEIVLGYTQVSGGAADSFTEAAGFTSLASVTQTDALRATFAIVTSASSLAYAPTLGTSRAWGANVLSFAGAVASPINRAARQSFLVI